MTKMRGLTVLCLVGILLAASVRQRVKIIEFPEKETTLIDLKIMNAAIALYMFNVLECSEHSTSPIATYLAIA